MDAEMGVGNLNNRTDTDNTDARAFTGASLGARASAGAGDVKLRMTASEFSADLYKMNHEERGRAVIFNHRHFSPSTGMGERSGTDADAASMNKILSEMGFDTIVKSDYKTQEMESLLNTVAREDHSDSDCFVCVILSHGEEGYVYGADGKIKIDTLVAPFKGHRCQTLAGKPKIFFIQACRGTQLDSGIDVEVTDARAEQGDLDLDVVDIRKIPTEADFLMAYSVVPGFFAWRNSTRGSWFVQALVQVLSEHWKTMDLLSMMTRVCRKVAFDFESNASKEFMNRKKQIPCITSMLTRDVYFTPKK